VKFKDEKEAQWFYRLLGTFGTQELLTMSLYSLYGAYLDTDDRMLMEWTAQMDLHREE